MMNRRTSAPITLRTAAVLAAVFAGLTLGIGAFTFRYAKGLSYFSHDPAACANCHIMEPQYDSWLKASHHTAAECIDCHLPHAGLEKWLAKAENGYRHSKGFTLQDFHEPILMTEGNARILQENCLRCHGDLVHDLVATAAADPASEVRCVHCHRTVGHGETLGLGGPERAAADPPNEEAER